MIRLPKCLLTLHGCKITIDNDRDICIMMLILFDDFSEASGDNSSPQSCIIFWSLRYTNPACILINLEKLDSTVFDTKMREKIV